MDLGEPVAQCGQTVVVDAQIGMGLGFGFGVKGNAKVGSLQHGDVVGTVADGNGTAAVLRGKLHEGGGRVGIKHIVCQKAACKNNGELVIVTFL